VNLTTIEAAVKHWVTFIKGHEKLLIVAISALVLIHLGDKAYDAYGQHLKNNVTVDNQKIAQIEADNAKQQATLANMIADLQKRIATDEAKIATAKQTVIIKQQQDAALPLPELSAHWQSMLSLPEGSITPQTNGTVAVTTDAAHATVNELEKVGPLQDQLTARTDEFNACVVTSTQKDTVITGLKSDVVAVQKGRDDDAKQAKHDIRHAYWRGFKHGFIVGVAATVAATVAILH
jgi:TolA-binding protein